MLGKEKQKYLASLQLKKKRKSEKKFIAEGTRSVLEGIKSDYHCEEIFVAGSNEEIEKILEIARKKKIKITEVKSTQLKKITNTIHPQNVAALFRIEETNFRYDDFLLVLDRISDPGNLGTIIRTADWFGIKNILIGCDSVDIFNPKVLRSTMGSIFHVNYKCVKNLADELKKMKEKNYRILLADLSGKSPEELEKTDEKKIALILSNEAHGVSGKVKSVADEKVAIPKFGDAESLNVSVAGGILIYEILKKIKK